MKEYACCGKMEFYICNKCGKVIKPLTGPEQIMEHDKQCSGK